MANRLVPPRRDQPITKDGILDLRTAIYLEENTAQTNESTELTGGSRIYQADNKC